MDEETRVTVGSRAPVIEPGHTFATVTDKISSIVLTRPASNAWFLGFGVTFLLTMMLLYAAGYLFIRGIGIWGVTIPVAWGFAIVNFLWWIGTGHAHPHLFQLHKRVNEAALACNLPIEERAWTPHFTIARARGISPALMKSFVKKYRDYDAGLIHVEEFRLYSSKLTGVGAIHTLELSVPSRE